VYAPIQAYNQCVTYDIPYKNKTVTKQLKWNEPAIRW